MEGKIGVGDIDTELSTIIKNADKVQVNQLTLFSPNIAPAPKQAKAVSE